jgi:hypothetical protein
MLAMMKTLPHGDRLNLEVFGSHLLSARIQPALPLILGLHSANYTTGYMDKIQYDAY